MGEATEVIVGAEQIPTTGAAIVAPNHKNFLDAFFVGVATPCPLHGQDRAVQRAAAVAVAEAGAFPVRRGEADTEAIETARVILADGRLVVVSPEGTRVQQPDALGSPHHGAGWLALKTGAPIIPAAIIGTSHLWRGALSKLRRVQLTFLAPVMPDQAADGDDLASELIDDRVWPAVQEEYGRFAA
jgi:1-acyl-sn-glycerol-3-phosphate acyltransferase